MHGGAKGSGAPKANQNALKHGAYTKRAVLRGSELRKIILEGSKLLRELS